MNETDIRTINTDFYGDRAYEILASVAGQLSDGMWENSRGYDKYWTNFSVKRLADNRVVFEVNKNSYTKWCKRYIDNPFVRMSDAEFLNWYAGKLKAVIRSEANDENWTKGWWNRSNTEMTSAYLSYDLDVTVADIYAVYDWLRGRKNRTDDVTCTRIWGHKADDEMIAKRNAMQREKETAAANYKNAVAALDEKLKKLTEEIAAEKSKAYKIYSDVLDDIKKKYAAA